MTSDNASLIEEYRNLVNTGAEYAAAELRLAPTSAFEIYIGHFRDIGRDIETALSTPPKVGSGELDAAGLEAARKAFWAAFHDGETARIRSAIRAYLALAAPVDHPEVVGVKELDDDQIMEIIKEVAPWRGEPELNDLLTYEKSPPLFPQATYDVPSYRATNFVRAVEARIRSALQPSDSPALEAGVVVTDAMVEAAEAAFYGRHERGFIMRPLIDPKDMRAALTAALAAREASR